MKLERSKGTKDFLPEEQIIRNSIVTALRDVFEQFGFSPIDTPSLEKYDILSSKYTGGSEILKEIFTLKDQGDRSLGLRYDLTVPLARVIGLNPQIKMPFKRYQMGYVWRDGPVSLGRYREFMQCDVDIIGCKTMLAETELITLTKTALEKLGFKAIIKISNRKILDGILLSLGVKQSQIGPVILSIDKLEKFGVDTVKKELSTQGIGREIVDKILDTISIKGTTDEKIEKLNDLLGSNEGLEEIRELFSYLEDFKSDVVFDISLARGLSYYTGTIFEVVLNNSRIKSSVVGGGRYDDMIGAFIGRGDFPAVGISFGLERLYDAYSERIDKKVKTVTQVYIIPINTVMSALTVAKELRGQNISADMDIMGRGPSKNLDYANKMNIPFVIFLGEDEVKLEKVKIKDMASGEEKLIPVSEVKKFIESHE